MGQLSRATVVGLVGLLLAGCGGGAVSTSPTPAVTGTVTETSTTAASPSPGAPTSGAESALAGATEAPETTPTDVNAITQASLDDATARWAGATGTDYIWSYREEGEGLVDEYCVEGVAGNGASDAAACPFEHAEGGQSVDAWLKTIQFVLDAAPETGRLVEATFDVESGYPLSILIFGGETDSFYLEFIDFEFLSPLVESDDPDAR